MRVQWAGRLDRSRRQASGNGGRRARKDGGLCLWWWLVCSRASVFQGPLRRYGLVEEKPRSCLINSEDGLARIRKGTGLFPGEETPLCLALDRDDGRVG